MTDGLASFCCCLTEHQRIGQILHEVISVLHSSPLLVNVTYNDLEDMLNEHKKGEKRLYNHDLTSSVTGLISSVDL